MAIGLAVGVPHLRGFDGYFLETMLGLSKPKDTRFIRVENKPVDLARNLIVENALRWPGMTHLAMIDSDMVLPADALLRLVMDGKDVVSGTYFARGETPHPHMYEFHHEDNPDGSCPLGKEHGETSGRWYRPMVQEFAAYMKRHPEYDELPLVTSFPQTPDSLTRIDAAGAGILVIQRKVLEALSWPWFKCHERSAGGEDFWFCEKAREAGFEVWGDWSVQCQHEFTGHFVDRADYKMAFHIGQPDEPDFTHDVIVDMSPQERVMSEAG